MSHDAEHKNTKRILFFLMEMSHSGLMYNAVFDFFFFLLYVILSYDLWQFAQNREDTVL